MSTSFHSIYQDVTLAICKTAKQWTVSSEGPMLTTDFSGLIKRTFDMGPGDSLSSHLMHLSSQMQMRIFFNVGPVHKILVASWLRPLQTQCVSPLWVQATPVNCKWESFFNVGLVHKTLIGKDLNHQQSV